MSELKPCPFCGSESASIVHDRVICWVCRGSGPPHTTKNGVILSWNRRAEPNPVLNRDDAIISRFEGVADVFRARVDRLRERVDGIDGALSAFDSAISRHDSDQHHADLWLEIGRTLARVEKLEQQNRERADEILTVTRSIDRMRAETK